MSNALTPFEKFADVIKTNYGITPVEIVAAPRGFAAETYYVNTKDESFFLKIMNNPGRQHLFMHGLKVLDALRSQGIDYVARIIPAADGRLYFNKDSAVLSLFTVINGKQSYNYDKKDVFMKLAKIYKASENFPDKESFMKENFGDWFISAYQNQIQDFFASDTKVIEAAEAKAILMPYYEFLKDCAAKAKEIVSLCKNQSSPFYLTHSDFPGNVMISEDGRQYLIDFDEALFGPLERDGWLCLAPQNDESELWLSVIKEAFPEYEVNRAFIRYYIYQRFMIDLSDFLKELLFNPDAEYRRKIVNSTKDYLMGWLYPIMLKFS